MIRTAILNISDPQCREHVTHLLDSRGIDYAQTEHPRVGQDGLLVFPGPGERRETKGALVRFWGRTRSDRSQNPFIDGTVRHVLGAFPTLEPSTLESTLRQIREGGFLQLVELLGAESEIQEERVWRSDQKSLQLDRLQSFSNRHAVSRRLHGDLAVILDELFTNAVYNAPIENGRRINAHLDRSVTAVSARPITIRLGHNENWVGVSVKDEYGSLETEKLMQNLFRCHRDEAASPSEKAGGAGLGLFMVLQKCNRMIVNIDPDRGTEIIALRRIDERHRDFGQSAPTLNICAGNNIERDISGRAQPRDRVSWAAAVCDHHHEPTVATLLDVSAGGAFIYSRVKAAYLEPGQPIALTVVRSTEPNPLSLQGVVRWNGFSHDHQCFGVGVQFSKPLQIPG